VLILSSHCRTVKDFCGLLYIPKTVSPLC